MSVLVWEGPPRPLQTGRQPPRTPQARSSQLKVSGIIKDDAGSPLIGVTIVVKGTSSGSVSNSDGSYTITVPYAEATLMVSYIGYAPQEINVNNRTRIDITMVEDSKALEEVVVVGYNVQKKETITRFDLDDHHQRPQAVPHGQHQQCAGRAHAGPAGQPVQRRRTG